MRRSVTFIATFIVAGTIADAHGKDPKEVYQSRIEAARKEYRVAIAKQIRAAKSLDICLLRFDVEGPDGSSGGYAADEDRLVFGYEVLSTRKLKQADAKRLLELLATQIEKPKHTGGAYCHLPIHGIHVYRNGNVHERHTVFSGTFCWTCENLVFRYPDGSTQRLDPNKELETLCKELMPIPADELKRFRKKHPGVFKKNNGVLKEQSHSILKHRGTEVTE